nr:alpha/beta hydrolase fold domain-containing protein [Pseudonocardia sp. C8]
MLAAFDAYTNQGIPDSVETTRGLPIREVDGWRVTADVHRPAGEGPFPVLVHLHGGAWVLGTPGTHRRLAGDLAELGLLTVVVDYRRAPKHRFPAAVDDAVHAVNWARQHASRLGGDPDRILVGGDSAGANLAAAALAAGGIGPITAALLFYGVYDVHRALPALRHLVGGDTPETQLYLEPDDARTLLDDPRLHPERYCTGFPPSLVLTGADDPLAAESAGLAERLSSVGVDHELVVLAGAPHGILQLPTHPGHRAGLDRVADFLDRRGIRSRAR